MPIVIVKNKFQVVIPAKVRAELGVKVGDVLEASVEKGKITFAPKSLIDRGIAESLEDFRRGRSYGPFDTAEEMIASLHANVRKLRAGRTSRRPR
jgi:AbrB family looped-hinge helix DNA binding protein